MDFFEHQEAARKKTGILVLYFSVCVLLIVAGVTVGIAGLLFYGGDQRGGEPAVLGQPLFYLAVAGGTLGVIVAGSLYKWVQLQTGGGAVVAQMLGGRVVDPATSDPETRKLLNVVEEMAIASGLPVPPVYLLDDEAGINAFAAGLTPATAVIGVTRGCVQHLNRDQLQGVMAHEFSHILNGDMRLNIRLIGVLHGILLLAILGYGILRSGTRHRVFSASRRNNKNSGGGAIAIGLVLVVIGYIGVFFGKLIHSAVSRQREYLADASAIQFTRNPGGIAAALKKIGSLPTGSKIHSSGAQETSHLFFGNGLGTPWFNAMATHPPLADRIKRIDPTFDGKFEALPTASETDRPRRAQNARSEPRGFDVAGAVASIGTLAAEKLATAAALIGSMPPPVRDAAHSGFLAQALVYAMLLDNDKPTRDKQMALLESHADAAVCRQTEALTGPVGRLDRSAGVAAAQMAMAALASLSPPQFDRFEANVGRLVAADEKISLFEFMLQRMVRRHLAVRFGKCKPPAVRFHALAPVMGAMSVVLSAVAHGGSGDARSVQEAFAHGAAVMSSADHAPRLLDAAGCPLAALDQALEVLAQASPGLKNRLMRGVGATIGADRQITDDEMELLRAVADALDCPVPTPS